METQREDLHDQLVAALRAAAELPPEDRQHLADVFLDSLDARYRLVPRDGNPTRSRDPGNGSLIRRWWPALAAAFVVFAVAPSILWFAVGGPPHAGHGYGSDPPAWTLPANGST